MRVACVEFSRSEKRRKEEEKEGRKKKKEGKKEKEEKARIRREIESKSNNTFPPAGIRLGACAHSPVGKQRKKEGKKDNNTHTLCVLWAVSSDKSLFLSPMSFLFTLPTNNFFPCKGKDHVDEDDTQFTATIRAFIPFSTLRETSFCSSKVWCMYERVCV